MTLEPPPHDGINLWVLSSARKCQLAGITPAEAEQQILSFQGQTRRPLKTSEVRRAVERAYNTTLAAAPSYVRKFEQKWNPAATRQTNHRQKLKGVSESDLWHASPWIMDGGVTQRMILDLLFPDPQGLVCVGRSAYEFHTARIDQFKDLTKCQFIVPCYMTKRKGLTQDGKESMHCLDNCGPRRFCVCDFDEPASDIHPAIIWHLRGIADLVLVLSSGGKSLHAWFSVPEDDEEEFWKAAVECGADIALKRNRSSFVRIPEGLRDNGNLQRAIYFDPSKIPA
jgi:hypothetical protein